MMRLLRKLFQRLPPKPVLRTEQELLEQRKEIERTLAAVRRQDRQREAIFLLEQEVEAVTAGRHRRPRSAS